MRVEIEELAAMMIPHGPSMDSIGASTNPDKLRPSDLAAALSGIDARGPYLLFIHTYLHDASCGPELLCELLKTLLEHPDLPRRLRKARRPLAELTRLALEETLHPYRCCKCNGTGIESRVVDGVFRDCPSCRGGGAIDKSRAMYRAREFGCSDRWWRKRWREAYDLLLAIIAEWQTLSRYQILARFGR